MSVKIADCTIRDGGYLLNKNSNPSFVKEVLSGLSKAGIDFVEIGYLQTKSNGETLVYHNSEDAKKYLPQDKKCTDFLGFCDNSRYSIESLDDYNGNSFRWLRVSFAKHELEDALIFCSKAQSKGYRVQFNPMDAVSYTDEEREYLIEKVNKIRPGCISIVDTFGSMYLDDLRHIFTHMDKMLNNEVQIGLHSHDNLGLSCAMAELMAEMSSETGRDIIIDGSLLGMGRGAGNAKTELLASFLNKKYEKKYDVSTLIEIIENHISPLKSEIFWGYSIPMFICGTEHSHIDNVNYLRDNMKCSSKEMLEIIRSMPIAERIRYGETYSKTDFSVLQSRYDLYRKEQTNHELR